MSENKAMLLKAIEDADKDIVKIALMWRQGKKGDGALKEIIDFREACARQLMDDARGVIYMNSAQRVEPLPDSATHVDFTMCAAAAPLCRPLPDDPGACGELFVWVERTWADVRQHDVVRPVGQPERAATILRRGPVNHWHVDHDSNPRWPTAKESTTIDVSMRALAGDVVINAPASPWLPVEIRVTEAELAAIEACGGWPNRVAINESDV